jgi:mannose/fructose/N-acetylgalactosamine-specific phosphotransferase system component IIC
MFSFVLIIGGFYGFLVALMVHNYLSNEFGWGFPYVTMVSLETVLTAMFGLVCIGATILGAFLALLAEDSLSTTELQKQVGA